ASAIHSAYSRLWLGGNFLNAAAAFLFFRNAAVSSLGMLTVFFATLRRGGGLTPCSFSRAPSLIRCSMVLSSGRSDRDLTLVICPFSSRPLPPGISAAFQR